MLKGRLVPAGTCVITVFSPDNFGKYSLAVGERDKFPLKEIIHAAGTVPRVTAQFFGDQLLAILASPFGCGYLLAVYLIAFTVGLIVRAIVRRVAKNEPFSRPHNIGFTDRLIRAGLGIALLG